MGRYECEVGAISNAKGSLIALATGVRRDLNQLCPFGTDSSHFAGQASQVPQEILRNCLDGRLEGKVASLEEVLVRPATFCPPLLSNCYWLAQLQRPGLEALSRSVPLGPLLLSLLEAVTCLADSLCNRIEL